MGRGRPAIPIPANTTTDRYWNAYSTTTNVELHDKTDKMFQGIPDETPLNKISILGTHDAGSVDSKLSRWRQGLTKYASTQTKDITEQLNLGVRYFDIRLNNNLQIVHGSVPFDYYFSEIANEIKDFLKSNQSEFVILNIRDETEGKEGDIVERAKDILGQKNYRLYNPIEIYGQAKKYILVMNCYRGCQGPHYKIQDNAKLNLHSVVYIKKLPDVMNHVNQTNNELSNLKDNQYNYFNYLS